MIEKFTAEELAVIMCELTESGECVFDKRSLVANAVKEIDGVFGRLYGANYRRANKDNVRNAVCLLADYAAGNVDVGFDVGRPRTVNINPYTYKKALDKLVKAITEIAFENGYKEAERVAQKKENHSAAEAIAEFEQRLDNARKGKANE